MSDFYKVTSASIETTKNGYKIYKLKLNSSIIATKLVPRDKVALIFDNLYKAYIKNNESFDFLIGKYISVYLSKNKYGFEFTKIDSLDLLQDFKSMLDSSKGKSFAPRLPIFDFLISIKRATEPDGSIKIVSNFGDVRISRVNGVDICYKYNTSDEYLNFKNIKKIFEKFYKDVVLPAHSPGDGGDKSYYKIDLYEAGIVRMDNHVKISLRATTSDDYDRWSSSSVLRIGDKLSDAQISFLKEHQ